MGQKKGGKRFTKRQVADAVQALFQAHPGEALSFKQIFKALKLNTHPAKMLAVDQMGTLCSQITRKQQTDAGITHYRWKARNDNRVRESHRAYNGKIFSWDDPPPSWYMTKSRGKVFTGRKCHPGEDYCCRCVAIPVFTENVVNLPIKGATETPEQILRATATPLT